MTSLLIRNVRSFTRLARGRLAPITLLVGDNSSGKTTFLGCVRALADTFSVLETPDFNTPPFSFGAFEQIVTRNRGLGPIPKFFDIGISTHDDGTRARHLRRPPGTIDITCRFVSVSAQPFLRSLTISGSIGRCSIHFKRDDDVGHVYLAIPNLFRGVLTVGQILGKTRKAQTRPRLHGIWDTFWYLRSYLLQNAGQSLPRRAKAKKIGQVIRVFEHYYFVYARRFFSFRPVALAPIRSKPERTYNPTKVGPIPDGTHVPMVLAQLSNQGKRDWISLRKKLQQFGRQSELFGHLRIRRLGRSSSDPFQIQVETGGPLTNLVDTGYGVSQVLPIVVDCLNAPERAMILLQQPEVHLHPKAQAALGTFLGDFAKATDRHLLIETHSDYLIDRIRLAVKQRRLSSADISILFFEKDGETTRISEISLDKSGMPKSPPASYRRFFFDEERSLLGLA